MQLKMIYRDFNDKIKIEEIEIVKETEKQYQIKGKNCYRSRLGKNELNHVLDGRLFTFDIQEGVKIWNEHIQQEINLCQIQISRLEKRKLVISDDYS